MSLGDRRIWGLLIVFVVGVALWRGGLLLLLGVILLLPLWLSGSYLTWRNLGGEDVTFRSWLGVPPSRLRSLRPSNHPVNL
jgi:hypothetical protein